MDERLRGASGSLQSLISSPAQGDLKSVSWTSAGCQRGSLTSHCSEIDVLLRAVQQRIADIYDTRKSHPSLSWLPDAVIVHIAEQLSVKERWILRQTGRVVRRALSDALHLWSHISCQLRAFAAPTKLHILGTALSLARSAHPRVAISVDQGLLNNEFADFLISNLPHISGLHLFLEFTYRMTPPLDSLLRILRDALSHPAPHLQEMELSNNLFVIEPSWWIDFLGRKAGVLRKLSLRHVDLPSTVFVPALSTLTTLRLHLNSLGERNLVALLNNTSALVELFIKARQFRVSSTRLSVGGSPLMPPTLRRVSYLVDLRRGGDDLAILFCDIQQVEVFLTIRFFQWLGTHTTSSSCDTAIYCSRSGSRILRLDSKPTCEAESRVEIVADTPTLPPARLPIAQCVVSLTVHEMMWLQFENAPILPRLASLRIVLDNCFEYRHDWGNSSRLFIAPLPVPHLRSRMPVLEELQIWYPDPTTGRCCRRPPVMMGISYPVLFACCCSNGNSILLADVTTLALSLVDDEKPKLARIVLAGVHQVVDVDLQSAFTAIYAVTEELVTLRRPPPDEEARLCDVTLNRFSASWQSDTF